jgi:hypothetical protein
MSSPPSGLNFIRPENGRAAARLREFVNERETPKLD